MLSAMQQAPLLPCTVRPTARLPFTAAARTAHRQACACNMPADAGGHAAQHPVQRAMQAAGTALSAMAVSAMFLTGGRGFYIHIRRSMDANHLVWVQVHEQPVASGSCK
jgi:hypothetical protein